jgi:PAS domain S-box-containing protein
MTSQLQSSVQAELEARLRFETLLADLSSKFINLPADRVDSEIQDAQRLVCACLGFDAVVLWQWTEDAREVFRLTHYYRVFAGPPVPERMNAAQNFPWFLHQALAGKVVAFSSVAQMPPEAARDREVLLHFGVKTGLNLPLSAGGGPIFGVLSFNDMQRERTWPEPLVNRLKLVAQVFANALERKRAERALQENEARLSLAADSAGAGLWSLNLATREFWLTDKTRQVLGLPPNEPVTWESFLAWIHADDRQPIQQTLEAMLKSGQETFAEYRVQRADGGLRWIVARGRVQRNGSGEPDRIMGVILDITPRKEAELELRNLSGRLMKAQEEERARLAKELHDGISQNLALLAVELDLLGQRPPEAVDHVKARMEEFSARTKGLLDEVHRLARGLHPAKLEQLGLASAMQALCREIESGAVVMPFEAHDVPRALPPDIALCLYRVAQEALWNVVKHSGARRVIVELVGKDNAVHLSIADDGKGFDSNAAPPGTSLGLVSMRERIRLVQGEIRWDSKPGHGTRVTARVPLPKGGPT